MRTLTTLVLLSSESHLKDFSLVLSTIKHSKYNLFHSVMIRFTELATVLHLQFMMHRNRVNIFSSHHERFDFLGGLLISGTMQMYP